MADDDDKQIDAIEDEGSMASTEKTVSQRRDEGEAAGDDSADTSAKEAQGASARPSSSDEGDKDEDESPLDEEASEEPKGASKPAKAEMKASRKGHANAVLCAVLGAALGVAITLVATGGVGPAASDGSSVTVDGDAREGATTVTLEELPDTVVGSYTYEGTTTDINANDVIALYVGVNNDVSDDDSSRYNLPSADYVLSYARAAILDHVAQEQGFDASDDESLDYVRQLLGDDSVTYDTASRQLGLSVDEIKKIASQTVRVQKLQQSVTGFVDEQPSEPDAPADDEVPSGGTAADVAKADYRDYVLALVGDAYDPDTNTWTDENSDYASALADYDLSASEYTYGCAEAAYSVAANDYYTKASDANSAWDDYVADIYSKASVSIYTLAIS